LKQEQAKKKKSPEKKKISEIIEPLDIDLDPDRID